jgi:hypothetical protein
MLFPLLTAEWLHLKRYLSTEIHNYRQNIIILFWKYLVDVRNEAWLNLVWEYMNGKWFAVKEIKNIALEGNKLRNNAFV